MLVKTNLNEFISARKWKYLTGWKKIPKSALFPTNNGSSVERELVLTIVRGTSITGDSTPILGHGGEGGSMVMTTIFYPSGSLFYATSQSEWHPLFAEKNGLFLSHLVPEILGHKVVQIFLQNILCNCF